MKRVIFGLFTSMLLLTSCNIINGIKGNGEVVSQDKTARGFNGVTVSGAVNVNVQPGADYKVTVTADSNLQEYLSVEVKDSVLTINTTSRVNLKPTKLVVDVSLPVLQSITLNGVSNVKVADGQAANLNILLSGVGKVDAQNYQVQNVTVQQSGVGDAIVWATTSLNGTLSGVGNIRYKGTPSVNVNVSGVGKLKKL